MVLRGSLGAEVPLAAALVSRRAVRSGFSGMLAGAMNVPIVAAVLGMEVFGVGFGIPAAIASIVAFQMNRHATIYDYALAGSGHLDELGRIDDLRISSWNSVAFPLRSRAQEGV